MPIQRTTFHIDELDCAEEVRLLRRQLESGPGIRQLDFDVLNSRMTIEYEAETVSAASLLRQIAGLGMKASLWREQDADGARDDGRRRLRLFLVLASGGALALGFLIQVWPTRSLASASSSAVVGQAGSVPVLARGVYCLSILAGLGFVLPRAWTALRRRRTDMNVLMCLAVAGAMGIGQWLEGATVSFLFSLALLLEHWSLGRARRAIGALLDVAPRNARCASPADGRVVEKRVEEVALDEVVVVRAGEKIPLDGVVLRGSSAVNQAPLTGESLPVFKHPGEPVFAGTLNGEGTLEFRVTRAADDTAVARIVHLVRDAQARRATAEQWVERFAQSYTPAMVALAAAVAVIPPLALSAAWSPWFYNGLVLLVIACPCALVISTPVSIVAALTAAVRHGVLVKGGQFLELAAQVQVVAFDKTGTLTTGRPELCSISPLAGFTEGEVLQLAATLESHSTHPVAGAIVRHAERLGIEPEQVTACQVVSGLGAEATVHGRKCWVGGSRLLREKFPDEASWLPQVQELRRAGQTAVLVGDESQVYGLIGVADRVRPEAAEALAALRRLGVQRLVMLTGDNPETARAISTAAGVDEYLAELLPENKLLAIQKLRSQFATVAMIGDGVNDAPAMAAASLSIAMGTVGSDVAIETADIALMAEDLTKIPWLIGLARRTMRTVRQNIAFALGLKLLFVILTLASVGSLWMAIAADTGASLLVIFHGLRLIRA